MKRVRNIRKKKRANNIDRVEERQSGTLRWIRLHTDFGDDVMRTGNSNAKKSGGHCASRHAMMSRIIEVPP